MNRWTCAVLASLAAMLVSACGGSDDDDGPVSPQAQCNSIGTQPKIVNGTPCGQPGQASVVLLQIQIGGNFARCSGTLVTPTRVLTAAHCLPAGTSEVLVGLWAPDGTVSGVPATNWVVHPQFTSTSNALINDVAVVNLSQGLPNQTMGILVSQGSASGQTVYMAGWGLPGLDLAVGAAVLDFVSNELVGFQFNGNLSDSCQGDSGGPVFRNIGGRAGVVGITSFGFAACGQPGGSRYTNAQGPSVIEFIRAQAPDAAYF
jgi:secreted trypsin-like serine protease